MERDVLRELAQAHSELLTRECECPNMPATEVPYACEFCNGTGRRLLTLEEALETRSLAGELLLLNRNGEKRRIDVYEGSSFECNSYREAAYRLLIELEASRG